MMRLLIVPHKTNEPIPYSLLLLADETKEAIDEYIYDSKLFYAYTELNPTPIGIIALYQVSSSVLEIKNIAIDNQEQNKGYGKQLIDFSIQYATENLYKELIVGTGDTSTQSMNFYLKNGFQPYNIRPNFFLENYPFPIYENGKQMQHMILFKRII
ncbi:MAG: GNAT family N-acetyltransferase [Bacteroides sp.]|nr:GNAT family N-acetyltransferase [Bacteroides sp.]